MGRHGRSSVSHRDQKEFKLGFWVTPTLYTYLLWAYSSITFRFSIFVMKNTDAGIDVRKSHRAVLKVEQKKGNRCAVF